MHKFPGTSMQFSKEKRSSFKTSVHTQEAFSFIQFRIKKLSSLHSQFYILQRTTEFCFEPMC